MDISLALFSGRLQRDVRGTVPGAVRAASPMLVGVLALVVACGSGRSKSWQYGYDHADSAITTMDSGVSAKFACGATMELAILLEVDLVREEVVEGCVQGVADAARRG